MRALLDACVLYPTVLRELLAGAAGAGLFTPFWSTRILEEWARAARRNHGAEDEARARAAAAVLEAAWPAACTATAGTGGITLPDPGDEHVLAAALAAGAGVIVTFNLSDFPPRTLARAGLRALDPDRFLCGFGQDVLPVVAEVARRAQDLAPAPVGVRALLKRARLPRLGKLAEQC